MKYVIPLVVGLSLIGPGAILAGGPIEIDLWPEFVPGPPSLTKGPEGDLTKPDDKLIAGRRIIKLGNVRKPQAHVFLPEQGKRNGGAVVICPGGGFHILAWDLEGTEIAEWLNKLGFAAIVLKYRVPTRPHGDADKWKGPVMDAQRAISLVRAKASEWKLDPDRIGILGFSAGGQTAALTTVKQQARLYQPIDKSDQNSCAPNFALLIYPGGIANDKGELKPEYKIDPKTPPMFFVHAADDRVSCLHSVALFAALKKAGVPSELHVYRTGGHGYGLRATDLPVTRWPNHAEDWLRGMKLKTGDGR